MNCLLTCSFPTFFVVVFRKNVKQKKPKTKEKKPYTPFPPPQPPSKVRLYVYFDRQWFQVSTVIIVNLMLAYVELQFHF